jgi:RimJ/RimL family protein N-acetyltransferase
MKKIIETNRLYLRELSVADDENFYLLNADEDVIKYTGDKAFESINEAKSFLENYNPYQEYGYGRWAVIAKSNEEFLGWCGLKYSPEIDEVDIGFRFFKKHWNKGLATESAKACLDYGFEKLSLKTIVGRAMEANVASIKVLEKLGMTFVGKFEFHLHDGVLYQIKKS